MLRKCALVALISVQPEHNHLVLAYLLQCIFVHLLSLAYKHACALIKPNLTYDYFCLYYRYFWIKRGSNECGLADCASYPVV